MFLAAQEMIDGRGGLECLGLGTLPFGAGCITAPGQEIGPSQMVNLGGRPQLGRLVEKPQALIRLVDRFGQDQEQLVTAFLDLLVFPLVPGLPAAAPVAQNLSEPGRAKTASAARADLRTASRSPGRSRPVKWASWTRASFRWQRNV